MLALTSSALSSSERGTDCDLLCGGPEDSVALSFMLGGIQSGAVLLQASKVLFNVQAGSAVQQNAGGHLAAASSPTSGVPSSSGEQSVAKRESAAE